MNPVKLNNMIECIKEHRDAFDMESYLVATGHVIPDRLQIENLNDPACQTKLCIAGFAMLLNHPKITNFEYFAKVSDNVGGRCHKRYPEELTPTEELMKYLECKYHEADFIANETVNEGNINNDQAIAFLENILNVGFQDARDDLIIELGLGNSFEDWEENRE